MDKNQLLSGLPAFNLDPALREARSNFKSFFRKDVSSLNVLIYNSTPHVYICGCVHLMKHILVWRIFSLMKGQFLTVCSVCIFINEN
jgi:hypothetical protein